MLISKGDQWRLLYTKASAGKKYSHKVYSQAVYVDKETVIQSLGKFQVQQMHIVWIDHMIRKKHIALQILENGATPMEGSFEPKDHLLSL